MSASVTTMRRSSRWLAGILAGVMAATGFTIAPAPVAAAPIPVIKIDKEPVVTTVNHRRNHWRGGHWRGNRGHWRGNRGWRGGRYYGHRRHYGYRRHYGHHHHGHSNWIYPGIAGFAAGALLGGVLAPGYYGNGYYGSGYYGRPRVVYGGYAQGSEAWYRYCANRYRSFDPASGTFLGYDGRRHYCR